MATAKTNDSRTNNARNLIKSLDNCDGSANAYMFIGRSTPWENDDDPPTPTSNLSEYYETHNEMMSLVRIRDIDARLMVPRIRWMSGITYDMYRHDYNTERRSVSNATNIYDAIYFTLSQNNYVYVCLFNNNNKPSLVEPQNITDEPFYTSDGYQWLKLYRVSDEIQQTHSTTNLIPIEYDEVTSTPEGAVYTVVVDNPGTRYTNNPGGPIEDVPDYYCHIVGDGVGGVAKVKVRSGSIDSVEVVRPGSGYTYAQLDFTAGRVHKGLLQLDTVRNGINPKGEGDFTSTVIISPPGGWGYNEDKDKSIEENKALAIDRLAFQLSSRTVGIFSNFKATNTDAYPNTTFRQLGILQDVQFEDERSVNAETLTAVHAVKFDSVSGLGFNVGEFIQQVNVDFDNQREVCTAKVVAWDNEDKILRFVYTKDAVNEHGHTLKLGGANVIKGVTTTTEGTPDIAFNETQSGVSFFRGYGYPEIKKNRGTMTFLSNLKPVQRMETQTERISLTITY